MFLVRRNGFVIRKIPGIYVTGSTERTRSQIAASMDYILVRSALVRSVPVLSWNKKETDRDKRAVTETADFSLIIAAKERRGIASPDGSRESKQRHCFEWVLDQWVTAMQDGEIENQKSIRSVLDVKWLRKMEQQYQKSNSGLPLSIRKVYQSATIAVGVSPFGFVPEENPQTNQVHEESNNLQWEPSN